MSPTKVLWLCAASISFGTATNKVGFISVAIVIAVMAVAGEVCFYIIRRQNRR